MEPHEMNLLVEESEKAWLGLGKVSYDLSEKEKKSLEFKRSIYVSADVKKGEVFTEQNTKVIRPAHGLHPRYFSIIQGKKATRDLSKGHPLKAEDVE
jgi:N-acetylneuraminate synthase